MTARPMDLWEIESFAPDPAGWHAVWTDPDAPGGIIVERIAGWLTLRGVTWNPATGIRKPMLEDGLRVAAGVADGGDVRPVHDDSNFRCLVPPGTDPLPYARDR